MPDIEILAKIANVLNANADYLIDKTNTTVKNGRIRTVYEFTGLSDSAAEFLAQLVKRNDYAKLEIINHLFQELCENYEFYRYEQHGAEESASSILRALFFYFARYS